MPASRQNAAALEVLRRVILGWALLGGGLLAGLVLVNVWTVLGGLMGLPFIGDLDLTQMGVAAAVFMFLPYCQLYRHNVTADIFTTGLSVRGRRRLDALASAVALLVAALLLWRMTQGLIDQKAYRLASTILQLPIWWAYVPIVISLALLVLAAVATLIEDIRGRA